MVSGLRAFMKICNKISENLNTFLTLTIITRLGKCLMEKKKTHLILFIDLIVVTCLCVWVSDSVEQQLCDSGTSWTWKCCSYMQGIQTFSL